jgi:hypothetical protein
MSFSLGAARTAPGWPRRVMPELLDDLPPDDPRAIRSRADLRRINWIMGAQSLLVRCLTTAGAGPSMRIVELGAGDGSLALRIARSRAQRWPGVALTLLDRAPSVPPETLDAIRALGWSVDVVAADVLDWLGGARAPRAGIAFANLFVHHFEGDHLAALLGGVADEFAAFACCEPRRSLVSLAGSHLLGLIGCNDVTRNDGVISVNAGFRDAELSKYWPRASDAWELHETGAGAFSHLFVARRRL